MAANTPQTSSQPISFGPGEGSATVHVPRTRSPSRAPTTPPGTSEAKSHALKVLLENMKQLDQRLEAVIAAGQAHDQRIIKLEADAKVLGDGMGTMGRHVQAMDDRVCAHIGGTVGDLNQALLAIDVALRKTVSALEDRLGEFQGSAKELMDRTHHGLTQLQERMSEAEKATRRVEMCQ